MLFTDLYHQYIFEDIEAILIIQNHLLNICSIILIENLIKCQLLQFILSLYLIIFLLLNHFVKLFNIIYQIQFLLIQFLEYCHININSIYQFILIFNQNLIKVRFLIINPVN